MMKRNLVIAMILWSILSCSKETDTIRLLSSQGKTSESVYLTHDHSGNPVAVWTEKDDGKIILVYAVSTDDGKSFPNRIEVPLDGQIATHAEGMPKIAFKLNGTVVIAYEKKAPTEQNKYAGAVYYRTSKDQGKSWTTEQYLHSDTVAGRSRSYFDIETLPDGEVGASWLDIKLNKETGGRSVRFAKTNSKNDFTSEILVDSSACQCCRVDLYTDVTGKVNIAYRGLLKGPMGKPIRDMMIATSGTNGSTFATPARISVDDWNIDGCPHTGPALCSSKGNLLALWYTEGNGTGIYYAHRENRENKFNSKQMISSFGHHPQASSNDNAVAMVWEENVDSDGTRVTRIQYQINDEKTLKKTIPTPEKSNAYSPVITPTRSGFIVAFIMEKGNESGIYYMNL
jgi:hypothetical protein